MFSSIRIAIILFCVAAVAASGYYINHLQNNLDIARANVARLEIAVQTSEESIKTLQGDFMKMQELNGKLQADLQKAEAYSDELRGKLSRLDLVQDALKDPIKLQGKMNGATAKLWRKFMEDTGSTDIRELPHWVLDSGTKDGTRKDNSDESGASSDSNGSTSKTTATE